MIKFTLALALSIALAAAVTPAALADDPTPADLLDALYYAVAIVEFCDVPVREAAANQMASTGLRLEQILGRDRATSDAMYAQIKASIALDPPDCSPDGPDVGGVLRVLAQQGVGN